MKVNNFKQIPAYTNAKRAIEVAMAADVYVSVFGRSAWGLSSLSSASIRIAESVGVGSYKIITHRVGYNDNTKELIDHMLSRSEYNICVVVGEENAKAIFRAIEHEPEGNEAVIKRVNDAIAIMNDIVFKPTSAVKAFIEISYEKLNLHAGSIHTIAKISSAIAALDGYKEVKLEHVAEAICYLPESLTPDDLEQLKQIV
jgi:hypothetical protein